MSFSKTINNKKIIIVQVDIENEKQTNNLLNH